MRRFVRGSILCKSCNEFRPDSNSESWFVPHVVIFFFRYRNRHAVQLARLRSAFKDRKKFWLSLRPTLLSHIKQKSLGFRGNSWQRSILFRMCCFFPPKAGVCGRLCECSISFPWSYFLYHSGGQYWLPVAIANQFLRCSIKKIVLFLKRNVLWLSSVLCRLACGTAPAINMCVWDCMHGNCHCIPLYFHM